MAPHLDFTREAVSEQRQCANSTHASPCLRDRHIVDAYRNPVILKGAGLAGHLNMENFITGFSGHEHQLRQAMAEVLVRNNQTIYSNA